MNIYLNEDRVVFTKWFKALEALKFLRLKFVCHLFKNKTAFTFGDKKVFIKECL